MLLRDFLVALKTTGIKITLVDVEGDEMIKFFSEGYANIESDLLARTIKRFDLTSATSISIVVNNPDNTSDDSTTDPDNTDPTDPSTGN